MAESKQINFTIVPADPHDHPRTYANFCAIAHTPFDITLTFCEVLPLTEKDLQEAEAEHVVRAPGAREHRRCRCRWSPNLIAALQEHVRVFSEQPPTEGLGQAAGPLTQTRKAPMKTATEARAVLGKLERQHPNADTELHYRMRSSCSSRPSSRRSPPTSA